MKNIKRFIIIGCLVLLLTGCGEALTIKNKDVEYLSGKYTVEMSIKKYGKITIELDADNAPITVTNFVNLVNEGFYNGNYINRVDKDFVIQGGEGVRDYIKGEFLANGVENNISHERGVISMARSGNQTEGYDTASTSFFIVVSDSTFLDNYYAAFGRVTKGMDVVDRINRKVTKVGENGMIEKESDMPVIEYIKLIEK